MGGEDHRAPVEAADTTWEIQLAQALPSGGWPTSSNTSSDDRRRARILSRASSSTWGPRRVPGQIGGGVARAGCALPRGSWGARWCRGSGCLAGEPAPQNRHTWAIEPVQVRSAAGHAHDQREGGSGDLRPGAAGEGPVVSAQP